MRLFSRDHMLGVVDARDQADVFRALAEAAVRLGVAEDAAAIAGEYALRESEATTGFGGGVAIPHAKTDDVSEATLLFARLSGPVEWHAIDGAPVDTVVSILAPTSGADEHLRLLAKLARKLMHEDFVAILKGGTEEETFEAIQEAIR